MTIFLFSGLDKEEKMSKIGLYGGFLRITASALNGKQFSRESLGVLELFPSCHKRRRPWKEFFPRAARRLIGVEDSCVMLEHARSFRCSCCSQGGFLRSTSCTCQMLLPRSLSLLAIDCARVRLLAVKTALWFYI